jgi:hypothetical protein
MPDLDRLIRPLSIIAWLHAAWQVAGLLLLVGLLRLTIILFHDMALFARTGGW